MDVQQSSIMRRAQIQDCGVLERNENIRVNEDIWGTHSKDTGYIWAIWNTSMSEACLTFIHFLRITLLRWSSLERVWWPWASWLAPTRSRNCVENQADESDLELLTFESYLCGSPLTFQSFASFVDPWYSILLGESDACLAQDPHEGSKQLKQTLAKRHVKLAGAQGMACHAEEMTQGRWHRGH